MDGGRLLNEWWLMTGNTASGLETITVSVGDSFMTL